MKSILRFVIFTALINLAFISNSQSNHTSKQTGSWTTNSTWVGNNKPNSNNNMVVNIKTSHTVTLTGNLNLNNNITINVEEGANFNVNGNINIGKNDNHPFNFTINGIATVTGNVTGVGDISGDGELNVGGTIGGSIDYIDFGGDISVDGELIWSDGPISGLPIDLLYFNAKAEGTVVNMDWATATEINNDFFTIERSINGNNWDIIDYVQGAGNTNYTIGYNFTDANPVEGIAYYRLKQTDFDGKFEYFAPVAVNFNNEVKAGEIMTVNAQGQRLNVWVNNQDAAANLVVANIQGRILYHGNVPATDYAQQINIDISQNIAGEILIIRLNTSQSSDERKIMAR